MVNRKLIFLGLFFSSLVNGLFIASSTIISAFAVVVIFKEGSSQIDLIFKGLVLVILIIGKLYVINNVNRGLEKGTGYNKFMLIIATDAVIAFLLMFVVKSMFVEMIVLAIWITFALVESLFISISTRNLNIEDYIPDELLRTENTEDETEKNQDNTD